MKNLFKKLVIGCLSLVTVCAASLFAACGNPDDNGNGGVDWADSDPSTASYKFVVKDEDGNAVKGVQIQICTEETCKESKSFAGLVTDANGVLVWHYIPDEYEVHVLTEDMKELEIVSAVTTTTDDSEYTLVVKNTINYVITVVDGEGNVLENIGVRLQDANNANNKTAGINTGADGKATINAVPDDYVVILNTRSANSYEIVSSDVSVSATKTEITVTVQPKAE